MQFEIILFLTISFSYIKGLLIYLFLLNSFTLYKLHLGQTTEAPNYSCNESNNVVKFTLFSAPHSAWQPALNCSLQQCYENSNNNNTCRSSSTPCFDYRTVNNSSYCAPGILCSILEPCDNMTLICASNTSICVVNSCCSQQPICLPLLLTNFCISGNDTFYSN